MVFWNVSCEIFSNTEWCNLNRNYCRTQLWHLTWSSWIFFKVKQDNYISNYFKSNLISKFHFKYKWIINMNLQVRKSRHKRLKKKKEIGTNAQQSFYSKALLNLGNIHWMWLSGFLLHISKFHHVCPNAVILIVCKRIYINFNYLSYNLSSTHKSNPFTF